MYITKPTVILGSSSKDDPAMGIPTSKKIQFATLNTHPPRNPPPQ